MYIHKFMEQVVPDDGLHATVINPVNSPKFRHTIYNNLDSFLYGCTDAATPPQNLYFAMASYEQGYHYDGSVDKDGNKKQVFRKQSNVKSVKSLWLDLDVGEGKPYATQVDAITALKNFISTTKMPTPWVVSSGSGGLHVYWVIEESLPASDWFILASKLHGATLQAGLSADPARTRDSASILRVPGSFNCKHNPPTEVRILLEGRPFPLAIYEEALKGYSAPSNAKATNSLSSLGIDDSILASLGSLMGNAADAIPDIKMDFPERNAEDVVAGCAQMREQADAIEPVWRGMLATLRHCAGGFDMSHKLSRQHPAYNENTTNEKIRLLEQEDVPPYTCATLKAFRPEVCAECPFNGVVNSPISVKASKINTVDVTETGEVVKVAKPTLQEELSAVTASTVTRSAIDIPTIDSGQFKCNDTGCYALHGNSDKSWWTRVYEYPVYPIQRIRGVTDDGDPSISYIFRRHHGRGKGYDDFQIPGEVLMGGGLINYLGSVGFIVATKHRKDMVSLMADLLRETDHDLEEVEVKNNLGWSKDFGTFLLGNKVYKSDGDVVDVTPKGKAQLYSNLTVARGELDVWKKIANVYNRVGLEWGQVVVLSAFASPLMPIGALEKAALIFITGDKGTGKSTALQMAVSVYGNPQRMMINKNDTAISRFEKLGILNNISAAFDEMTDLKPYEASQLTYQITQGRGKDRMSEGGKGIQTNTTEWSCLPVMSANDSMMDSLARHSFDATAQMSRFLEVRSININDVYDDEERFMCEKLVRELPNNYGTAGDAYIRYLVTHQDEIKTLILKIEALFVKESGLNNSYRFWTYMSTRLIVGNMIANKLGLLKYDTQKLFKYLVGQVQQAVHNIARYQWSPENLLSDFFLEHVGERLVVKCSRRPPDVKGTGDYGYMISSPIGTSDLSIRIELEEKRAFISRHTIKNWCKQQSVPFDAFIKSIEKNGKLLSAKRRITIGRGTQFATLGRTECIEVQLDDDTCVLDSTEENT